MQEKENNLSVRSALLSWSLSVSIDTRSTLKIIHKHSPVFFKDEMEGQGLESCILFSTSGSEVMKPLIFFSWSHFHPPIRQMISRLTIFFPQNTLCIFKEQWDSLSFTHWQNPSFGNVTDGCSSDFSTSTTLNLNND